MRKPPDDDANDTVPVERIDPTDPGLPNARASGPASAGYHHEADDLTPLPPPRVLASLIAEEAGRNPPTGPTPLPPVPAPPRPIEARPLERASLGPRRILLRGSLAPRQLVDPDDARFTLALWVASSAVGALLLVWALVDIVGAVRADATPVVGTLVALAALLLYPALLDGREVLGARIASAGIEIGPDQLREEWQVYVDVASRLGVRRPPRLYLYDAPPSVARLLGLVRGRCVVVSRAAVASPETLPLVLGRALGTQLVGHDEPLDMALMVPLRLVSAAIAWPLSWVGLGLSVMNALAAARTFTSDRAACVGAGQLGLVLDEILGGGDRGLAARIDAAMVEGGEAGLHRGVRLLHQLSSPVPPPGRRVARLQSFAAPYLVRE